MLSMVQGQAVTQPTAAPCAVRPVDKLPHLRAVREEGDRPAVLRGHTGAQQVILDIGTELR